MISKQCKNCGVTLQRKRWKNGSLESGFSKRMFCSRKCCGEFRAKENKCITPCASRKRAQRAYPVLPPCERCGSKKRVQRHHKDIKDALSVQFLCQSCHTAEDMMLGKWGRGPKSIKTCMICGSGFTNYTYTRAKTCSRECLSKIGRRNAMKRWHPESTASGPLETQSSRNARSEHSENCGTEQ